jgi:hypothetical protein
MNNMAEPVHEIRILPGRSAILRVVGLRRHIGYEHVDIVPAAVFRNESRRPVGLASVSTESCDSGVDMQCLSKYMDYCDPSAGIPNWDILLSRSRL